MSQLELALRAGTTQRTVEAFLPADSATAAFLTRAAGRVDR